MKVSILSGNTFLQTLVSFSIVVAANHCLWLSRCHAAQLEDNFESYAAGTFPSAGNWQLIAAGSLPTYGLIDANPPQWNSKALNVRGSANPCRGSVAYQSLDLAPQFLIEADLRISGDLSAGCSPMAASFGVMSSGQGGPGGFGPTFGQFEFGSDGFMRGRGDEVSTLMAYEKDRWYHIESAYDLIRGVVTFKIDGEAKGSVSFKNILGNPTGIHLGVPGAISASAWIDNVRISGGAQGLFAPRVIEGPITNSANGHTYYLLGKSSWRQAETVAAQLGGHLATINNKAEHDWAYSRFGGTRDIWIGLYDKNILQNLTDPSLRRQEFTWANRETVAYSGWASNQPGNTTGGTAGQFYAVLINRNYSASGHWNDLNDLANYSGNPGSFGLVEIPSWNMPSVLAGPIINPANGHQYYLLNPSTWQEAESYAGQLGGHLATVRNMAESTWIFSAFGNFDGISRNLWIGAFDKNPNQNAITSTTRATEFGWASAETVTYTRFANRAPSTDALESFVYIWGSRGNPTDTTGTSPGLWGNLDTRSVLYDVGMHGVVEVVPPDPDSDRDGLLDDWEMKYFGSLTSDGTADSDADRLKNIEEHVARTDPTKSDTDGDGFHDASEVTLKSNPLEASSTPDTSLQMVIKSVDIEFNTIHGMNYDLKASRDLISWDILQKVPGSDSLFRTNVDVRGTGYRFFTAPPSAQP